MGIYEGTPDPSPPSPQSSVPSSSSGFQRMRASISQTAEAATARVSTAVSGAKAKPKAKSQVVLHLGCYYQTLNTSTLREDETLTSAEVASVEPNTRVLLLEAA